MTTRRPTSSFPPLYANREKGARSQTELLSVEPVSKRFACAGGAGDRFETSVASDVGQRYGLYCDAQWISRRMDSGVIGVAFTVTPRGARASLTTMSAVRNLTSWRLALTQLSRRAREQRSLSSSGRISPRRHPMPRPHWVPSRVGGACRSLCGPPSVRRSFRHRHETGRS
jgi:hypothetical protein